jgi:secreted trypsin-like serine protease
MRRAPVTCLIVALVLALTAGPASAAPAAGPGGATPSIIGGGYASSGPWAAALYYSDGFYCSGSIIASRWVLTAQHCIYDGYAMSVRVGNVRHPSGRFANVQRVVRAPGADMALLYLDRAISTTYAQLASANPPNGSTNDIYGWGTVEPGEDAPLSDRLKTATVLVTSSNGSDYYGGRAVRSRVLSGGPGYGDSGGPQFYNGRQVGVCSTGDYVNQSYASVAANRTWIRNTADV